MVEEASNGNEAVQLHRQLNPDVTLICRSGASMQALSSGHGGNSSRLVTCETKARGTAAQSSPRAPAVDTA
jgi:hypothetical protein